jgi:hypothetical protein
MQGLVVLAYFSNFSADRKIRLASGLFKLGPQFPIGRHGPVKAVQRGLTIVPSGWRDGNC